MSEIGHLILMHLLRLLLLCAYIVVHMTVTFTVLFSWHGQIFPVPSHAGELWIVGSHVPFGLRRSSAGGHRPERCIFAEQGATVEDVEYSSQPPYRHNHPGRKVCCTCPIIVETGLRGSVMRSLEAAVKPKINTKSCKFILSRYSQMKWTKGMHWSTTSAPYTQPWCSLLHTY